jgi:hypothetical protein
MMSHLCNHRVREFLILARTWFAFGLPSKTGCDRRAPPRPTPHRAPHAAAWCTPAGPHAIPLPSKTTSLLIRSSLNVHPLKTATTTFPVQLPPCSPTPPRRRQARGRVLLVCARPLHCPLVTKVSPFFLFPIPAVTSFSLSIPTANSPRHDPHWLRQTAAPPRCSGPRLSLSLSLLDTGEVPVTPTPAHPATSVLVSPDESLAKLPLHRSELSCPVHSSMAKGSPYAQTSRAPRPVPRSSPGSARGAAARALRGLAAGWRGMRNPARPRSATRRGRPRPFSRDSTLGEALRAPARPARPWRARGSSVRPPSRSCAPRHDYPCPSVGFVRVRLAEPVHLP